MRFTLVLGSISTPLAVPNIIAPNSMSAHDRLILDPDMYELWGQISILMHDHEFQLLFLNQKS